ncbi:Uncharacterised protein [Salmonella enterica]|nr:Uncharacterised protein [Salmonella enterica]
MLFYSYVSVTEFTKNHWLLINKTKCSREINGFFNEMVAPYILCHSGAINRQYLSGADIMNVKTIGIDFVKEDFYVHRIDKHGSPR